MRIQEETVVLPTPTGHMRTLVVAPADSAPGRPRPGIALFSEIFQITGPVRRAAAFLAGHGFAVAVPEIFHDLEEPGCVLPYDKEGGERGNADKVARPVRAYDDDARAVIEHLLARPDATGGVGAMGFCIGGHLALRAALHPAVRAAVCFQPTDVHKGSLGSGGDDTLARLGDVRAELLLVLGRQDPHVPWEGRRRIHDALEAAGADYAWLELNAAHAAMRDEQSAGRFDPEVQRAVQDLALALFRRRL